MSGPAHGKRANRWIVLRHRFIGQLAHQVAHNRLHRTDRAAFSLKIYSGILVYHGIVFTVIVPYRLAAILDQTLLQILFPVLAVLFFGKVDENSGSTPPCTDSRLIRCAVEDEHLLFLHLLQKRMNEKHSRLYIRGDNDARLLHLCKPVRRVLESFIIPGKAASLDALLCLNGTVSGRKLETIHRNALFPGGVNEFQDCIVTVLRQFRIVHRRSQVSECRLWKKYGLSCQIGVALNNLPDRRSRDQE